MPTSSPRVQTSSGPRPVGPTHVYPTGSQMMMIPQQQISFAGSPQGYFLPPGQYRQPQYMAPTPQYPVTSGTAGFFPGTSPAEYPAYAGAYYPAQPQFSQTVQPTPVIITPTQPPQQAPPPQQPPAQPQGPPKRERKPITIRDPNQGGRDITEEIMSGGRSTSTPTPPQASSDEPVQNASTSPAPEVTLETVTLETVTLETVTLETVTEAGVPMPAAEASVEATVEASPPLVAEQQPPAPSVLPPPSSPPAGEPEAEVSDTVDAPVNPFAAKYREEDQPTTSAATKKMSEEEEKMEKPQEVKKSEPVQSIGAKLKEEPAKEPPVSVISSSEVTYEAAGVPQEHTVKAASEPVVEPQASVEEIATPPSEKPASAEPAPLPLVETPLSNGLAQEADETLEDSTPEDATPLAKPVSCQLLTTTRLADPAQKLEQEEKKDDMEEVTTEKIEEASATLPTKDSTMQAAVSVPKKKRNMKELNKKEAIGDLLDAFKEERELSRKQWKPINPEDKKMYDREFLLGCQFISASMHKPEGLPLINEVILDKANNTPMRPADPTRVMNIGPDFTPSYLGNLGRQSTGAQRGPPPGPRRSQQGQRKEPRKIIISTMSLNNDVQLNKAEKAWKPGVKKAGRGHDEEDAADRDDPEQATTQELFKRVRSILNKLTPQMFQQLMKQVMELSIDTEARLKGVIDLLFEKAISEPNFSVAYGNMCRCLMGLKVPTTDDPANTVTFRNLLLNRCQKEFEKDQADDVIFEKKQKELDASKDDEERDRLKVELEESKTQARRRSLGNIKFIGELFKLKMLTEAIMHDCVVKLLKNHDEESLECLCRLLSTIGKDLDFEKAKPRMEQYFTQLDKVTKERKTSSRIRFMLLDVLDLRRCKWVPRRGDLGPKTIDQIHKDAEAEEQREHMKPQDEGWKTVPISTKSRPIDTTRFSKITKPGAQDVDDQRLAPGGRGFGNWTKGSSGGTGSKPPGVEQDSGRPATSTVNRFTALQQSGTPSAGDSDRRVPQRSSTSRDRGGERDRNDRDRLDQQEGQDDRGSRPPITKRSFSRESQERGGEGRGPTEPVRRVSSMTDDRSRRDRACSKEPPVKDRAPTPPPADSKPALTEEKLEKKSNAIIEEFIHLNDLKEALQCVSELNSASLLFVFVRSGVESTLERSPLARGHLGHLLHQLVKAGTLPPQQYYKGLQETLESAEDMAIDIPHIWVYLAELIAPMLHEGGIPMAQLFSEISKPLVPSGKAGGLLSKILMLLCKEMTHKKVGVMWIEAGLNWSSFLAKDEDVNKFVTEQKVEFTLDAEESKGDEKKPLAGEEMGAQLDRLLQDKADNQRIIDWVEANLNEQQSTGNQFVRALMTSVCQYAIICDNPYKVDVMQIRERAILLQRYLSDEPKELHALYALQALMVHMEQPANLLRMFFDTLYDEDVIKEDAFYKWESSKDSAEQTGKGVALKSVTTFFTWLRVAEEESDKE
ncbi:hypothetical protein NHX12_004269 [Muraenolepis orangiensis]|uniref:Eukaryotic translation initiation factor 4 gamma 1-like n=1 Tax=Muraenolepis orangiensis TaxID=630683 RepID=A0A9Q0DSI1_9TELE|nr:hypothetical protein NHX12_004269 [Muraenolepis orangiensis]